MDYKKIISSKTLRLKILTILDFIPDKVMIKLQYRIKMGRKLYLKNPIRYTEKLQWYKLYYKDPVMKICADKYHVRDYVKNKGLEGILIPLYGIYNEVNEIDFSSLPIPCVIKTTNGGGGENVLLISSEKDLDIEEIKLKLIDWMKLRKKDFGREGVYQSKPKIIVEKMLPRDSNNDLPDYKFFCFDGKVHCLYTMINYVDNHNLGKLGFYNKEFNKLPFYRKDFSPIDIDIQKPKNFEKMIEIAEILSSNFPHVRVDLYNIDGEIYFGELTFFTASGYIEFNSDEFDFILGKAFKLPNKLL